MTDIVPPSTEPLRFERTFHTGPDFANRFTRAYFGYVYSRPRRFVPLIVIFVACFALLALPEVGHANGNFVTFGSAYVGFLVVIAVVSYLATTAQIRKRFPGGSEFGIGFRSETMVVRSPLVTSEVAYSLYKSCERRGRFVMLKQRVSRLTSLLPAEIFTDESFAYLSSKIASSAP